MEVEKVDQIIETYGGEKQALIGILHDTQAEYGFLPKEAMKRRVLLYANWYRRPTTMAPYSSWKTM